MPILAYNWQPSFQLNSLPPEIGHRARMIFIRLCYLIGTLMTCQRCNQVIPDDSIFCELCGAPQSVRTDQPAPVHQAAATAAQGLGTSVQSFWGTIGLPNKIAFVGCIAA